MHQSHYLMAIFLKLPLNMSSREEWIANIFIEEIFMQFSISVLYELQYDSEFPISECDADRYQLQSEYIESTVVSAIISHDVAFSCWKRGILSRQHCR